MVHDHKVDEKQIHRNHEAESPNHEGRKRPAPEILNQKLKLKQKDSGWTFKNHSRYDKIKLHMLLDKKLYSGLNRIIKFLNRVQISKLPS